MKRLLDIKRFKLYAWIGLADLGLGLLGDLVQHTREIGGRAPNQIWLALYLTTVNYFFFEYTLPRLRWEKFGRTFLLVILHLFLYSKGIWLWRKLGLAIHWYTPYGDWELDDAMSFSVS